MNAKNAKRDKEYWKKRCELAENVIKTSGIVGGWEFVVWEGYVNHNSNIPWIESPPPPPKRKCIDRGTDELNRWFFK